MKWWLSVFDDDNGAGFWEDLWAIRLVIKVEQIFIKFWAFEVILITNIHSFINDITILHTYPQKTLQKIKNSSKKNLSQK